MTLPDFPSNVSGFHSGLPDDLLMAIGHLAVVSARLEETLHKVYWRYAKLDRKNGPIVTDNLNPKRLFEDIIKFAKIRPSPKHNIVADLSLLSTEFEALNTSRNQVMHWIWSRTFLPSPKRLRISTSAPMQARLVLQRPIYKQRATEEGSTPTAESIKKLCDDVSWLETRLTAHGLSEKRLRRYRKDYDAKGALSGFSFADVFVPAPWLDKPPSPKTKRSGRRDGQK